MDILLAHAYYLYEDPHERQVMKPYPPLGILYLSSYLKAQGFAVGVFDSTFASMADFETLLRQERPSVVGIYVNLMTKFNALKMIALAHQHGARVILGGPEPPYYAAEYLQRDADVIVKGEGELTLAELLPHLARHGMNGLESIAGIAYLGDNGNLCETQPRAFIPDLSANPWADREAIDIPRYMATWKTHHGQSSVSVIHARGCPYTCTWCSHSVYGNTHRRRTPEDAANELLWIKERYNPDLIWYADDVFAINHRWLYAYSDALKQRGVRIPFECISRADRLNEDVVRTLADMGCFRLWNGSESGSQKVLDAMQRKVQVGDVQAKTHLLKQHGIQAGMFIMLGYDGEEVEDITATVEHLKKCDPDVFLTTVAYPIKGTPYHAKVEASVYTDRAWEVVSDRDMEIGGRHTRKFYRYATRWMVNEVSLNRARLHGGASLAARAKMAANIVIGRAGMLATARGRSGPKPLNGGQRLHIGL
ncbi:MAG: radical SAM protein [Chloroflexota bacterium]|nr:radical SAM protein [Chloroflexota bacterium]